MEESKPVFYKTGIFYSSIFAVVVCSLAFYFLSYKPAHTSNKEAQQELAIVTKTNNDTDSDHDGLPDWKEAVYGSDPSNKDTDGDGILDGAEVATGHDPTKKGPDDLLHNLSLGNSTSTTSTSSPEKEFVREFLSKEIENTGSAIVTKMIKNYDATQIKPRYSLRDLNVISDNSDEQLRQYAHDFGTIMDKYQKNNTEDESKIVANAIKTKRDSDLQKIELPAIEYRNAAEELRKLPVPSSLAPDHLNIVSGYDTMSRSLFATERLLVNPIEGGAGWQMYLTQSMTVLRGYAGAIHIFKDKGIAFTDKEPGRYFAWPKTSGVK